MKNRSLLCTFVLVFLFCSVEFSWAQSENDPYSKIGPLLRKQIEEGRIPPSAPFSANEMPLEEGEETSDLIKVIVVMDRPHLEELSSTLVEELKIRVESLGGYLGDHAFNNVQVWLPIENIEELATWSEIKAIRLPIKPQINAITSEGLNVISGLMSWQNGGYTGSGVKIGVLDSGFKGYSYLLGTELPANVTHKVSGYISDFLSDPHGTACAEIVYDIAPDAQMYLVNVVDMDVDFMNAVKWLKTQGVNVVSCSVALNTRFFGLYVYEILHGYNSDITYMLNRMQNFTYICEQLDYVVNYATSNGMIWSQSAGNEGDKQWIAQFSPNSTIEYNEIVVSGARPGESVHLVMVWPYDGDLSTYDDYDLYILNEFGSVVCQSDLNQKTLPIGLEACKFYPSPYVRYFAVIERISAYPHNLGLLLGAHDFPSFKNPTRKGSIELSPPATNKNIITVGAVAYETPNSIESYSCQGPTPEGIIKPDLVAPDAVSTYSYPYAFHGTSAAAPHVAGICALVKQRFPSWSPAQVKAYLESNARDLGAPGKDNVFGSGLVRLPEISSPPGSWVNINGRITYGGNPVCAMALANGQYTFTCSGDGTYSLRVPLDSKGQITVYAFCSGLAPFKRVIYPYEGQDMRITLEKATPGQGMDVTCLITPTSATRARLSGAVYYKGSPVCAMVLANGQYMFTCSGDGSFSLDVPLDSKGGVTFFAFCSGLPPYRYDFTNEQIK